MSAGVMSMPTGLAGRSGFGTGSGGRQHDSGSTGLSAPGRKRSEQMGGLDDTVDPEADAFEIPKIQVDSAVLDKAKSAVGTAAKAVAVTGAVAGVAVIGTGVAGGMAAKKAMDRTMNGIESGLTGILMGAMAMSPTEEKLANSIQASKDVMDKRKQRMSSINAPHGGSSGMSGMSL